jgi:hypothetical protein
MADYSLTGNANWSAIKASLSNNDRIVADGLGAWVLTLDEDPALTGIDFVSAAGAYIAFGAISTFTANGWKIRPTSNHGISLTSGKTITGPVTLYGSTTTSSRHGCSAEGGALGTVIAYGGTVSATNGLYISDRGVTVGTLTSTSGSASSAHGCSNYGAVTTATNTGGSTNNAHGMVNYGAVTTATNTGGSTSGSHGLVNYGGVKCTANTGNTSGAFGLDNWGVAMSDVRNRVGDYAVRRSRGLLILYGGTSTTGITGTAGDLLYIPTPANTVDGVSVMGESGTYPLTATTQAERDAANAATLEAQKGDLRDGTTVTFGASSVTGTLDVAAEQGEGIIGG